MLFAKASTDQMGVIVKCIEEFSRVSGLHISPAKSQLFVSPNTGHQTAALLSSLSDGQSWNFFGCPYYCRVTKETYAHLVAHGAVLRRLADWKGRILSTAGRRTLIQSTASAIPLYTMQTALLPTAVCKRLDQIHSHFLWGGHADASRNHLVSWKKVCQPKTNGGLGLRQDSLGYALQTGLATT